MRAANPAHAVQQPRVAGLDECYGYMTATRIRIVNTRPNVAFSGANSLRRQARPTAVSWVGRNVLLHFELEDLVEADHATLARGIEHARGQISLRA